MKGRLNGCTAWMLGAVLLIAFAFFGSRDAENRAAQKKAEIGALPEKRQIERFISTNGDDEELYDPKVVQKAMKIVNARTAKAEAEYKRSPAYRQDQLNNCALLGKWMHEDGAILTEQRMKMFKDNDCPPAVLGR